MLSVENLVISNPLSKSVSHVFEINLKNIGDSNVTVTKVSPSCSCSTTSTSNFDIKPGETKSVPLTISLIDIVGDIFKSADIYYLYKGKDYAVNWSVKFTQI